MSQGRTIWRAKDSTWHEREWIVILVQEFGPAGYAVIDYLEAQAKLQNDGGRVKAGPNAIARATGADLVTVGHVLSRSVTLGLLEDWSDDAGRFTCRISGWQADQERAGAASRKANQRSRESANAGDQGPAVTVSHAASRSVTECPPTGQDRTELPTADAVGSARRPPARRVDQSRLPDDLPDQLAARVPDVLRLLTDAWDLRGGVQPQERGVALGMLRNPNADHAAVARKLQHWLTAGKGQRSKCADIAARFGDWVADEVAGTTPRTAARPSMSELDAQRMAALERQKGRNAA